jgi:hypothetical protein
MTDQTLLMFGIGISFIVLSGVYVFFRESYARPAGVVPPHRARAT